MERWRLMEEFELIAKNQPVWPGNTLSHSGVKALARAGLTKRNSEGDHILTDRGEQLWEWWDQVKESRE